tara:strand:+ start:2598 stop:3554 length:957 start_codon:yes stop_codon:yes gene_type:complete
MANFYMNNRDWNKIQNYSRHAYNEYKSEIGGFLIAEQDEDNKWKMHKPVILKQVISGGNTVLDKDALAEYYVKTALKMKDKPFQFVWWHSHHTMGVFWSGTDLEAIEEFSNGQMSVSLVVNLKQEYKLRVNLWKPYEMHEDVKMDIIDKPKTKVVPKAIRNEVDKLCEEPTNITTSYTGWSHGKYLPNATQNQLALWNKNTPKDDELVQVEARLDNVLMDYITSLDYGMYRVNVDELNTNLKKRKSELRIGIADKQDERYLFEAMSVFSAEDWIYPKKETWSFLDKCIEYDLGETNDWENEVYNKLWNGGKTNDKPTI